MRQQSCLRHNRAASKETNRFKTGEFLARLPSTKMPTILVVDDEPVVLNLVVAILKRERYVVLMAATADEAREQTRLHKDEISLLIVNYTLATETGRNLVDELLLRQPQMKVLRYSGHLERELRARGEIHPESSFIQKPFLPRELVSKVRGIIGPAL